MLNYIKLNEGIIDKFIGDTVNTASRIESSCKQLKTNYVVSDNFYNNLSKENKKNFISKPYSIKVKGKEDGITVYRFSK